MATTTERGYGWEHQQAKARLRPSVDAGQTHCTERLCLEEHDGRTRWIRPGTPWDLAHDRRTGGYLGPAHARCNRAEGARYRAWLRRNRRPRSPRRWAL